MSSEHVLDNELRTIPSALGQAPLGAAAFLALLHVAVDPPILNGRAHHADLQSDRILRETHLGAKYEIPTATDLVEAREYFALRRNVDDDAQVDHGDAGEDGEGEAEAEAAADGPLAGAHHRQVGVVDSHCFKD